MKIEFKAEELISKNGKSYPVVGGRLRIAHELNEKFSISTAMVTFESGVEAVGVEEVTPHVMRHTFISHLLVYGRQDLLTVSRLAGHASIETTQIYLHLIGGDEQKRSAVESLPDYED